jgi:D-glycerate 3-kinase
VNDLIEAFIARERLPTEFADLVAALHRPLADAVLARLRSAGGPLVVGLCGPQGSGKSTGADVLRLLLAADGVACAVLRLDDLYLPHAARRHLAQRVHPLLATRGPPGTHDPAMGRALIRSLTQAGATALPAFDKAMDDRAPASKWPRAPGPVRVVIFEGWCVGARPQAPDDLIAPINALEAARDGEGIWRRFVNEALAGPYQTLFEAIGLLIMLRPPSFEAIFDWRREQEAKLRQAGGGPRVLSDEAVSVFIQHFERVARHLDQEMPARADVVVTLDRRRRVTDMALKRSV